MIGRWHGLIIDSPDPAALASFYERLLSMQRIQDEGDWVVIGDAPDRPGIAFQRVSDFQAPTWPDPTVPQQMHLDIRVDNLDDGERASSSWAPLTCPVAGPRSAFSPTPPVTPSAWS